MAYAGANNAAFRITGFTFGNGTAFLGKISFMLEKVVMREVLQTDEINYPEARPIDNLDSRATVEFLGWDATAADDEGPDDLAIEGDEAGGGPWAIAAGQYQVGGFRLGVRRRNGGNPMAQDFEQEGPLSFSASM